MSSGTDKPHWSDRLPPEEADALARYSSSDMIVPTMDAPVLMVIDVVESFVGPDTGLAEAQR